MYTPDILIRRNDGKIEIHDKTDHVCSTESHDEDGGAKVDLYLGTNYQGAVLRIKTDKEWNRPLVQETSEGYEIHFPSFHSAVNVFSSLDSVLSRYLPAAYDGCRYRE